MKYYRWNDGTMLEGYITLDEQDCIRDGILSEVVVIDKEKWDRLVKHISEIAGSCECLQCQEIGDIIQEVEK